MHIIVLGAGVTGITSAWYLRQAGHEVTVIDRQPAAGLETSFANGGQVSVSHAEPWANPGAPAKVLKWLMKEDAPCSFACGPIRPSGAGAWPFCANARRAAPRAISAAW